VAAVDDWAVQRRLARPNAIDAWKRLVATARIADPDEARDRLRQLWSEPDRKGQREPLLKLAKEANPRNWPPRSLTLLARALADAGEHAAAVELLRRAQAEHPGDVWINYRLAWNLEQLHPPQTDDAIRFYSVARALRPETAHELAHALENRGRGDEAVVVFRDLTARRPGNGRHWLCLGVMLKTRGDRAGSDVALQQAVTALREAIRLTPGDFTVHGNLGLALGRQGKLAEAMAEFREAIRLAPDDAIVHTNFGDALRHQGKPAEAIAEQREAIRLKPDYANAHYNLGLALSKHGKLEEATAAFREAIRLKPDDADAHYNLGHILSEQGKHDEAIAEYREAIRLKPDSAEAHTNLGYHLRGQGKLAEAMAEYREAIRIRPDLETAHLNLGAILCDVVHDYSAAEAEFRETIRLKPDDTGARLGLGNALRGQGKLAEAIAEFREAIRLKPNLVEAHGGLADVLDDQGKPTEAMAEYREAIRLAPDTAETHCNLANALRRQGKYNESLAEYRRGHELGSKRPGWPYPSGQWVRRAERRVELGGRLPAVIRGDDKPKDAAERLEFADFAYNTKRFAPSVRLYAQAFQADSKLAEDMKAWSRYNAACAAVLASADKGNSQAPPDEKEKARLRKQGLDWLKADLSHWIKQADSGKPEAKALVRQRLQHWKADSDLVGIRDETALQALPEDERKAFRALWGEVDALLAKVRAGPAARPQK
jgi:tetratricopeptide (TPR) repeat protein